MKDRPIRIYADTSVFGGVADEEFKKASLRFFNLVRAGKFQLVVSATIEDELVKAPDDIRALYQEMLEFADLIELNPEAIGLQTAYLKANILASQHDLDAQHVALATVANCAIIVSWNFKHIVNFRRIPLFNAVNISKGYRPLAIHSPMEVISDEPEEIRLR